MLDHPKALDTPAAEMLTQLDRPSTACRRPRLDVIVLAHAGRRSTPGVDLQALGHHRLDRGQVGDMVDLAEQAVTNRLAAIQRW